MFGDVNKYRCLLRGEGGSWAAFDPASFDVIDYDDRDQNGEKQREAAQQRQQERRDRVRTDEDSGHYEGGTFVRDQPKWAATTRAPAAVGANTSTAADNAPNHAASWDRRRRLLSP